MSDTMHTVTVAATFFFMHILLGRKISIPYMLAIGTNVHTLIVFAIVLDVLQIPVFEHLYTHTSNTGIMQRISARIEQRSRHLEKSRLVLWARKMGIAGIVVVSAMPIQGGGMWSGVLLTHVLKLRRAYTYGLLTLGSIIGCTLIAFGVSKILALF